MLRKTLLHCLRNANLPVPTNSLRITCCNFSTTRWNYSDEPKSVLVDVERRKPDTPQKWRLDSVLSPQQTNTFNVIQELNKPVDVLQFLKNNNNIIVPLYAPLFNRIFQLLKSSKFDMTKEQFTQSREFENFCIKVKKSARILRPNDNVNILKTLSNLGVSMNSIICQHLLQVLSKNINELTLRELNFVSFLLKNAPTSPIVEAIKLSAPIVFDTNVRTKLNARDAKSVVEALSYAAEYKLSNESIDIIVIALLALRDQLNIKQIKSVAICLFRIRMLNNSRKELIRFCLDKLNEEMMEKLSFNDVNSLVVRIVSNFLFMDSFYYDEAFLSNAARYVIEKRLGIYEAGVILRTYCRISHINIDLLNYTDKLLNEVNFDEFKDRISLLSFISSCSNACYKPPNWTNYENRFVDYLINMEVIDVPLIRTVVELISLQCWPTKLIEKVFHEDFLRKYLDRDKNLLDYLAVVNLYQVVLTLYPGEYRGPLPPSDILNAAGDLMKNHEKDMCLQPSMEMLFGGEKFVLSGISTKLYHSIDHLVILRKDGQPYQLRDEGQTIEYLEDVVIPSNSFPFAVIVMNPTAFCIDGVRIRGKMKLIFETLETLGVITVPISSIIWQSLDDREKLPFIKREIFSRIPANDSAASNEIFLEE